MTETFKSSLLRILLTPEHWNALHNFAADNKVGVSESASAILENFLNQLLDESDYINSLSASNDIA
jgi:hypothetical protein